MFGCCRRRLLGLLLLMLVLAATAPARPVRLDLNRFPVPIPGLVQLDAVDLRPVKPMLERQAQEEGRLGQVLEGLIAAEFLI
jgi:hypothetical protein